MSKIEKFEDLHCWQSSRILAKEIFLICKTPPLSKDFGTQDQIRRASLSVMNNIAEGFNRYHRKEFKHFLDIAQSSAAEINSMLYLLEDINYVDSQTINKIRQLTKETQSQILGLIKYLSLKDSK